MTTKFALSVSLLERLRPSWTWQWSSGTEEKSQLHAVQSTMLSVAFCHCHTPFATDGSTKIKMCRINFPFPKFIHYKSSFHVFHSHRHAMIESLTNIHTQCIHPRTWTRTHTGAFTECKCVTSIIIKCASLEEYSSVVEFILHMKKRTRSQSLTSVPSNQRKFHRNWNLETEIYKGERASKRWKQKKWMLRTQNTGKLWRKICMEHYRCYAALRPIV